MGKKLYLVSAAIARAHILALSNLGVGFKAVAEACDMERVHVSRIRSGKIRRISLRSQSRILSVDAGALADGAKVDGTETRKHVRDLRAMGFTFAQLARDCLKCVDAAQARQLLTRAFKPRRGWPATWLAKGRVRADTAWRVRRFHRLALAGTVTPQSWKVHSAETRRIARLLLHLYTPKQLQRKTGYLGTHFPARIRADKAANIAKLYGELKAQWDDEPLPDRWQLNENPFAAIGADEYARGGWRVCRRP